MGIPTSEVGYTSATTGMGDHEVHKGHVVALKKNIPKIQKWLQPLDTEHVISQSVKAPCKWNWP
jgi:hypothetical protein